MYCSNCGHPGTGNFCSKCGCPLESSHIEDSKKSDAAKNDDVPLNWREELNYERLVVYPEVKTRLQRALANSRTDLSAEEFLKASDKLVAPITQGMGAESIVKAIQSLTSSLGAKMERSQTAIFQEPIGEVIVATLCTLARNSQKIRWVQQLRDGIELDTAIPSSLFNLEGDLTISINHSTAGTKLVLASRLHGQIYDFGKSTRALNAIVKDIRSQLIEAI